MLTEIGSFPLVHIMHVGVNDEGPRRVDPKMQYSEYYRPSRPVVSAEHQAKIDIENPADEFQKY